MPVYLDHAATTALSPNAVDAMTRARHLTGNPSSLHSAGRAARAMAEDAREQIAYCLGASAADVVLTAGATEADNLAVIGLYRARRAADARRRLLIVSPTEHHAVLDVVDYLVAHEAAEVHWLAIDAHGVVNVADLHQALAAADGSLPALVAVMSANNETGTRQPLHEIAQLCADFDVPWHCDAVQSAAWERLAFTALGCATMAVSAHKVGGPVGVGALLIRSAVVVSPISYGGGQERKVRSGTINTAAAVGFAAALADCVSHIDSGMPSRVRELRTGLTSRICELDPTAVINGGEDVLPSILNVTFPGCDADALLMLLDAQGIACSLGAACTAGVPEPSHVLLAMGATQEDASASLRFSFGADSTMSDVDAVIAALPSALAKAHAAVMAR
ncbi:MAG: cysteine desulfurase [Actinobacteria bacterium]|nr:cysteine desulfurase [Actinomycetota bacterium]